MRQKAAEHGLDINVDSAGTSGWHDGNPPDPRSISNTKQNGIDISRQESRKVIVPDFKMFDRIYAMDASNYENLINLAPKEYHGKIKMVLNELHPGENMSVPDPYYGNDGFQLVFDLLNDACESIALELKK